jgi:hypothetical protein
VRHRPPADVARLAVPAVDVDLSPVVVLAGRPPHGLWRVPAPDGVDPVRPDTLGHELDEVGPDRLELAAPERPPRPQWVDALAEEDLRAVDVADPGDDLLVEEQLSDRPPTGADPPPGPRRVGVGPQRVRSQPGHDPPAFLRRHQDAPGRAAQVGVRRREPVVGGGEPEPDLPHGRYGGSARDPEAADEAQVDVDNPVPVEHAEEVLARGVGLHEAGAVEQRGLGGEAALRARDPHDPAGEGRREVVGQPAEGVPLRHRSPTDHPAPIPAAAGGSGSFRSRRASRSAARAAGRR